MNVVRPCFAFVLSSVALMVAGTVSASVVPIDSLAAGPNAIDPSGAESINTTHGNTTEAALELRDDFRVLQDPDGKNDGGVLVTSPGPANFSDVFDNPRYFQPDIATYFIDDDTNDGNDFRFANAGKNRTDNAWNTSPGVSYDVAQNSGWDGIFRIDFGKYDANAGTWATNTASVDAASFVWVNSDFNSMTVTFHADDGTVLSTLPISASSSDELLIAYDSLDGESIGYIDVFVDSASFDAVDDIGFTLIPEPASAALLTLAGLTLLRRRRRA